MEKRLLCGVESGLRYGEKEAESQEAGGRFVVAPLSHSRMGIFYFLHRFWRYEAHLHHTYFVTLADEHVKEEQFSQGFLSKSQIRAVKNLTEDLTITHLILMSQKPFIPLTEIPAEYEQPGG